MILIQIAVGVVLYALFFCMCYMATGTDKKNMNGFRSYPDEVQERVCKDETLGELAPKRVSIPITILSNVMMFSVIFVIIGVVGKKHLGLYDFKTAALYFFLLGEGLNLFNLVVIDLLWWRNSKRIRFVCVPEKDAYQNPKKHVDSFLRGIPTFALVAVLAGWIVTLIG